LQTVLASATRIDTTGVSPLLPRVENSLLAYAALVVMARAAHYFALLKTRQVHASQLEARLAKTHLQLLRMQLQPHFLFNTLNTVAELVHSDPDTADQMITRLGRLLRLSLDHAGHQVVPLRQEIDFLRMYVEIEQVRFQDRGPGHARCRSTDPVVASGSGECDPTRGHTPGRTRTHRDRLSPRWGRPHSGDPR
jgi:hypothetical protein